MLVSLFLFYLEVEYLTEKWLRLVLARTSSVTCRSPAVRTVLHRLTLWKIVRPPTLWNKGERCPTPSSRRLEHGFPCPISSDAGTPSMARYASLALVACLLVATACDAPDKVARLEKQNQELQAEIKKGRRRLTMICRRSVQKRRGLGSMKTGVTIRIRYCWSLRTITTRA